MGVLGVPPLARSEVYGKLSLLHTLTVRNFNSRNAVTPDLAREAQPASKFNVNNGLKVDIALRHPQ